MTCRCPHCGLAPDSSDPRDIIARIDLGPMERIIVGRLARQFGRWVQRADVVDAVYSGARIADTAPNYISVRVSQLRPKLLPFGFVIDGKPTYGFRLRSLSA